jgi:hypothetical protein
MAARISWEYTVQVLLFRGPYKVLQNPLQAQPTQIKKINELQGYRTKNMISRNWFRVVHLDNWEITWRLYLVPVLYQTVL